MLHFFCFEVVVLRSLDVPFLQNSEADFLALYEATHVGFANRHLTQILLQNRGLLLVKLTETADKLLAQQLADGALFLPHFGRRNCGFVEHAD